jgi:arylsulfatase A-like enzyme
MDLMPTMLDLAGASVPADHELDGESVRDVLLNGESLKTRTVFWDRPRLDNRAIRRGPWKLVINQRGAEDLPKLFHLGRDLSEENDLAQKHPQKVEQLKARFEQLKRSVRKNATQQPTEKMEPPEWLR